MSSLAALCRIGEPVVHVDPKQAEMWAQLPAAARHLVEMCKRTSGNAPHIYRAEYAADFQLSPATVQRGGAPRSIQVVAGIQGTLQPALKQALEGGSKMCLLSAAVDECAGSQLAVPISWRLDLLPRAAEPLEASKLPAAARLPFDPQAHVPRSFVASPGQYWRAPSHDAREALLTEPLVYTDSMYAVSFAATEAWGFDASALLRGVAEPSGDGSYFIPLTYPYSSLLARVHGCIVLANAQRDHNALYAMTMPATVFTLQGTNEGWEIGGADLSAAIEYIEKRLLPALVVLPDPSQLTLVVKPFSAQRWNDVWTRHQAAQRTAQTSTLKMAPGSAPGKEIRCTLRIVAYFADLAESGAAPPVDLSDHHGEERIMIIGERTMRIAPYTPPRPLPLDEPRLAVGSATSNASPIYTSLPPMAQMLAAVEDGSNTQRSDAATIPDNGEDDMSEVSQLHH